MSIPDENPRARGKRNFRELRVQALKPILLSSTNCSQQDDGVSAIGDANSSVPSLTASNLPHTSTKNHGLSGVPELESRLSAISPNIFSERASLTATSTKTISSQLSTTSCSSTVSSSKLSSGLKFATQASANGLSQDINTPLVATDFEQIRELGQGNGGTVRLVRHTPSGLLVAMKGLFFQTEDTGTAVKTTSSSLENQEEDKLKRQVVRELQILQTCNNEYIVSYYGAFLKDREVSICMEYMNLGSLDKLYRKIGQIEEGAIGWITVSVLEGLVYLYLNYRIIHRDVKPNNILVNSKGQFKICDFGVSGEAINSVVKTFVGTSGYMSPERITGGVYSVQSDIWSLGITLLEIAIGRFPFPPEGQEVNLSVFELLDYIVNEKAPRLPTSGQFSASFQDFLDRCLIKQSHLRPTPSQLMLHDFVKNAKQSTVDMEAWAKRIQATISSRDNN